MEDEVEKTELPCDESSGTAEFKEREKRKDAKANFN